MVLVERQYYSSYCYNSIGQRVRCNSSWNNWGRWVALGVILVGFFLLFFCCSCFSARRRRKAGRQPFYGTGWAGGNGHGQAQYNPQYTPGTQAPVQNSYNNQAPPNYNQSGGYYGGGANQSYFGGQQTDVEMHPPQNTYARGGDGVYQPPSGPPPNKV